MGSMMKTISIVGVGIVLMCLYGILAFDDEGLLSNFHQNAYKLRNLRADVDSVNKKFVKRFEIKTFKFNRTVTAFNFTVCTKYDFADKLDYVVQVYKRASNEYRLFPIRMRLNYCKYFNKYIYGLRNMLSCGNFTSCVLKKGIVYHACNFVIDETKFPPLIPTGEFKAEVTTMFGDEVVGVTNAYAEVYLPN